MKSKYLTYLDYNATAPIYSEVIEAMTQALKEIGSPSSVHAFGRRAHQLLEEARKVLASHTEAKPNEVIFLSGASEANNMVLRGFEEQGCDILVSAVEHASVRLASTKSQVIPVSADGLIDLEALDKILRTRQSTLPFLVSVMYANNETGVIQPIGDVVKITKKYGGFIHCDAVQAFGRLPFSFRDMNVDTVSLSAHKVGGAVGTGALLLKENLILPPLIKGAGQESNRRAGTQNTAGVVGFSVAAQQVKKEDWRKTEALRNLLETKIEKIAPEVQFFGREHLRLPNTACFTMPGVTNEFQVMAFDLEGFAVSAGAACSSGKISNSPVLEAMGVASDVATSAIRVSLTPQTQEQDIERFVECWNKIYKKVHKLSLETSYQKNNFPSKSDEENYVIQ
jgi:cysteine desulfurase